MKYQKFDKVLYIQELLAIFTVSLFTYLFHIHFDLLWLVYGQISDKCFKFRNSTYWRERRVFQYESETVLRLLKHSTFLRSGIY